MVDVRSLLRKEIAIAIIIGIGSFSFFPGLQVEEAHAEDHVTTEKITEDTLLNTLSSLEINGVPLDQEFSSALLRYKATVNSEIKSINLLVKSDNPHARMTINEEQIQSGIAMDLSLHSGDNVFLIKVDDGVNTPVTYTLTINKKLSTNNFLQGISLSEGKLSHNFDSKLTDYIVNVSSSTKSITVLPKIMDMASTVLVNGSVISDKGKVVNLPIGKTKIAIIVTSESGEKKTYTIMVNREEENKQSASSKQEKPEQTLQPSKISQNMPKQIENAIQKTETSSAQKDKISKATLSSLTVSEGTWNKSFSSSEYTYHLTVSDDVNSVVLSPITTYSGATYTIEGSTSKTVKLKNNRKKTVISVIVSKDDNRKTYVLIFEKNTKDNEEKTEVNTTMTTESTLSNTVSMNNKGPVITERQGTQQKSSTTLWGKIKSFISSLFGG